MPKEVSQTMEKIATVVTTDGEKAWVQLLRASACGENCSSCSASCKKTKHTAEVRNTIGAVAGQKVKVEMGSGSFLFVTFLAYIVPLLALFVGYGVTYLLSHNDVTADIVGLGALIFSFFVLRLVDRNLGQKEKYISEITKILGDE